MRCSSSLRLTVNDRAVQVSGSLTHDSIPPTFVAESSFLHDVLFCSPVSRCLPAVLRNYEDRGSRALSQSVEVDIT